MENYGSDEKYQEKLTDLELHIRVLKVNPMGAGILDDVEGQKFNLALSNSLKKIVELLLSDKPDEAMEIFDRFLSARKKKKEESEKNKLQKLSPEQKQNRLKEIVETMTSLEREKAQLEELMR